MYVIVSVINKGLLRILHLIVAKRLRSDGILKDPKVCSSLLDLACSSVKRPRTITLQSACSYFIKNFIEYELPSLRCLNLKQIWTCRPNKYLNEDICK